MRDPSPSAVPLAVSRLGPVDVLVFAAWCGLVAGEFEVAATIARRALSSTQQLYLMSRHFVWLIPLVNLLLFLGLGLALALTARRWPRFVGWLSPRLIIASAVFPVLMVSGPGIYLETWLLVALGVAFRTAAVLERTLPRVRHVPLLSVPFLLGLVLLQAGSIFGGDRIKKWREESRPLPAVGSPNVLLIVLDTVRADHLSLYGYPRPTSPNLERLARRGIRFDEARAAAPWTLASHASLFTGKWPHELAIKWSCPMRGDVTTLAEHLGSLGYATAGFAANTFYCSYDSGLDRGFTHYQDHVLDALSAARTVRLVSESLKAVGQLGRHWALPPLTCRKLTHGERKEALVVNREFLNWLSLRTEPRRPFFAFLNYVDAHAPYLLPPGNTHRLGPKPTSDRELAFLADGWTKANTRRIPQSARLLTRNAYDDCVAYLDQRLGELVDELQRRGVLDETLVIVTADHGEGLGEHELFDHGESLYRPEIRVPLVIVLPASRGQSAGNVTEFVSLRDIAATIALFVGPGTKSPFPGRSLLPISPVRATPGLAARADDYVVFSELAAPNPSDPNGGRSPAHRGPLVALAEGDFVYIRNEGDGAEELFDRRDDPDEFINRARGEAMQPVVRGFRARLARARAGSPAAR